MQPRSFRGDGKEIYDSVSGEPDQDRLREEIIKAINTLDWSQAEFGTTPSDNDYANVLQALIAREVRLAKLKARWEVRGDYLFMMNTHDFGRPFSYEKILQITKEAYSELEAELSKEDTPNERRIP